MATSVSAVNTFTQDQVLQLLVSQLQNQDPLDPVDNNDFVNQITQLSTLQSIQSLNASFAQILQLQQLSSGADLVGKTITFSTLEGSILSGVVDRVDANNGSIFLVVGNNQVPLDNVQTVQ